MNTIDPRLIRLLESTSYPGLRLLALFGSRARVDAGGLADWDLGYLADRAFSSSGLWRNRHCRPSSQCIAVLPNR